MHNKMEELLKETKKKTAIYLYPSQVEEIKSLMDQANAKSQSEFVSAMAGRCSSIAVRKSRLKRLGWMNTMQPLSTGRVDSVTL